MDRNSRRLHILTAASTIVKTHGVEKLTLEAVARQAGLSKGGLLHHFPNKQALISAMMEESAKKFVADINNRILNATTDHGKWSRAYLEITLEDVKEEHGINAALIASLFTNPDLLEKLQSTFSKLQKNMENDGIDPIQSTIVRLAVDGLWFSEIFGVGNLSSELREEVIQCLTNMTKSKEASS